MRRFLTRHWVGLSFVLFLGLAFAFTAGAWAHPTITWAGGVGDPDKFINFLSWYPFAISHGHNPFFDGYLNLPGGTNMMWETTMPLPAVLAWPVNAIWGPIFTYNAVLVAGLALDGWCSLLWLRRHVKNPAAVIIAALIMEFGPYTGSRAAGHLNLLLIFAFPLLLITLEEIFFHQRWSFRKAGLLAGLAAAVQLFCTEETLAIFALGAAGVLVIAAIAKRDFLTRERILFAAKAISVAAVVFLVIAGYPLYYQFFGPARVHGVIQAAELYKNSPFNLVIPNGIAWLQLPIYHGLQTRWPITIDSIEANSYVGPFMLLIALYTLIRWRHDIWVVGATIMAASAWILALGPTLQYGSHSVPLPDRIVTHLPIFDNILPGRYCVALDLALALLLAIFLERRVFTRASLRFSFAGGLFALAACLTLASAPPSVTQAVIPPYFTSSNGVHDLPTGSHVLIAPFFNGSATLWQAESDFHVKLDEGNALHADAHGKGGFYVAGPLFDVYTSIENSGVEARHTEQLRSAVVSQLNSDATQYIIVGPMVNQAEAVDFTSWLLGKQPELNQGVYVWQMPGSQT